MRQVYLQGFFMSGCIFLHACRRKQEKGENSIRYLDRDFIHDAEKEFLALVSHN